MLNNNLISSVESQKGVIAAQRCSVENQALLLYKVNGNSCSQLTIMLYLFIYRRTFYGFLSQMMCSVSSIIRNWSR